MLYNRHHFLFPKFFTAPVRTSVPKVITLQSPPPSPQPLVTSDLLSVSINFPILDISCKWDHICLFCLASFTQHNAFKVHPCCSMYQYFTHFLWLNNVHYVDIPHFFIHSSVDGNLNCFYFGSIMNNAAMNIHTQVFMWTYFFISLGYILRNEIPGSYGNSMFIFLKNYKTVF